MAIQERKKANTQKIGASVIAFAATIGTLAIQPRLEAQSPVQSQQVQFCSVKSLPELEKGLNPQQLYSLLGIGAPVPNNLKIYPIGGGYKGPGIYEDEKNQMTCPALNEGMLVNWYFALYQSYYPDPKNNGHLLRPDADLEKAVKKAHSKGIHFGLARAESLFTRNGGLGAQLSQYGNTPLGNVASEADNDAVGYGKNAIPKQKQNSTAQVSAVIPQSVQQKAVDKPQAKTAMSSNPVKNIELILTSAQQQKYLGVGNQIPYTPNGIKTYIGAKGWQGDGIYYINTIDSTYTTPYLSAASGGKQQLTNWMAVCTGQGDSTTMDQTFLDAVRKARSASNK